MITVFCRLCSRILELVVGHKTGVGYCSLGQSKSTVCTTVGPLDFCSRQKGTATDTGKRDAKDCRGRSASIQWVYVRMLVQEIRY